MSASRCAGGQSARRRQGRARRYPDIKAQQPDGLNSEIIYDSTDFVNSSIDEVIRTLLEALAIVTAVVFLFLGSWRSC